MTDPRHDLGHRAEDAVAAWLDRQGWVVLARRWRQRGAGGELDLVARDRDGSLVAVEVKLRRTGRAGSPADGVDRRRLLRLRTALGRYAAEAEEAYRDLRIDLVTVMPEGDAWRLRRVAGIDGW